MIHTRKLTLLLTAGIILFITACTKSDLKPGTSVSASSQENSFAKDADFITRLTDSGTTIVNYRPGPGNGEDVYSDFYTGHPSENQNAIPELPINAWNYGGYILTRSFIKFPKLYKFPATATVVSAKLYLYPPTNFLNHPQGNTGANECVIQRITSKNWQEDSLTWVTQPKGVTTDDEAFIPATTNQYGYAPVIDLTAAIAKMINRQVNNYGFRITLVNEEPFAALNFASSEAATAGIRPMLQVEYK